MLIESLIQRANGTHVDLGGVVYHFSPRKADGRHVAEVEDEDHVQRFLDIPEGYAEAPPTEATDGTKQPAERPQDDPKAPSNADRRKELMAEFKAKNDGKSPTGNAASLAGLRKALGHD